MYWGTPEGRTGERERKAKKRGIKRQIYYTIVWNVRNWQYSGYLEASLYLYMSFLPEEVLYTHNHPQSHQYAKINTQYMAHDGIAFCMKRKHHNAWFMLSVHIKEQGTLYTNRYMRSNSLAQRSYTVFSPAYLRHVSSTSLHYKIPFDVGNGDNPKALKWLQAPPTPCPPIVPWILLGENTGVQYKGAAYNTMQVQQCRREPTLKMCGFLSFARTKVKGNDLTTQIIGGVL